MTFDGLVRSKERTQTVSTRLFAVTAVIVALVVLAFFLFAPGSRHESPTIAGIGEGEPSPADDLGAPPARRDPPPPARPSASGTKKPAAPAVEAPAETSPPAAARDEAHPSSATPQQPTPAAVPGPEAIVRPSPEDEDREVESTRSAPTVPQSGAPAAGAPDGSVPFERSADYVAALAQIDGGQLGGAAQSFQRLVGGQEPGLFTLQLMIACQPETVMRARAESGDEGSLYVLPYTYKGQSCYRACWGIYSDGREAQAAIGGLPAAYSEAGIKPIVVPLDRLRGPR